MSNVTELGRVRPADGAEVIKLKRELEATRQRLEEEVVYYQAELEATRQRVEKQHMRLHAEEVARRRRAEEQVQALKAELREAQLETERARGRYEALSQQLLQNEESSRRRTEEEVGKVRAAARAAWQSAEEELHRVEQELASVKRLLLQERERNKQLEETVNRLRAEKAAAERPDRESLRLIASLKKALWTTAQARRRAEMELARLKTADVPRDEVEQINEVYQTFQNRPKETSEAPPRWAPGGYTELDSDVLKSLVVGSGIDDLSDEFMVMPADASLDQDTFDRLQRMPDTGPELIRTPPPAVAPAPRAAPPPRRDEFPDISEFEPAAWRIADEPRKQRSRLGKLQLLASAAVGAVLVYWLLATGMLS